MNIVPIKYVSTYSYINYSFDFELNETVNAIIINNHRLVIKNRINLIVKKQENYPFSIRIGDNWLNFDDEHKKCHYTGYIKQTDILDLMDNKIKLTPISEEVVLKAIPVLYKISELKAVLYDLFQIQTNKNLCILKKNKYIFLAPNCIYFTSNMELGVEKAINRLTTTIGEPDMHYYYNPVIWYKGKRDNQLTWPKVTNKKPLKDYIEYPKNSGVYYYGNKIGLKKIKHQYPQKYIPVLNHKVYKNIAKIPKFTPNKEGDFVQILDRNFNVSYIIENNIVIKINQQYRCNNEYPFWPYNFREIINDAVLNNRYSISEKNLISIPNIGIYNNEEILIPKILEFIIESTALFSKTIFMVTIKSQEDCKITYDYD